MLPDIVRDAGVLEGNPLNLLEDKTLMERITVGRHIQSDQAQILHLITSSKRLLTWVKKGEFKLDKATFCALHRLVARNEALKWGHFRGEGQETHYTPDVSLGEQGRYTPLPTAQRAPELNRVFM